MEAETTKKEGGNWDSASTWCWKREIQTSPPPPPSRSTNHLEGHPWVQCLTNVHWSINKVSPAASPSIRNVLVQRSSGFQSSQRVQTSPIHFLPLQSIFWVTKNRAKFFSVTFKNKKGHIFRLQQIDLYSKSHHIAVKFYLPCALLESNKLYPEAIILTRRENHVRLQSAMALLKSSHGQELILHPFRCQE